MNDQDTHTHILLERVNKYPPWYWHTWHWSTENPYLATYLKTTSQAKEPQETLYGPLRTPSIENNIFASSPPPLVRHPPPHASLSILLPPDSPAMLCTISVD